MKKITTLGLFEILEKENIFSKVTDEKTFSTIISGPYINRPGLALSGYFERFSYDRVQILGDPEVGYIQSSSKDEIYENIKRMFTYSIPCLFFCKGKRQRASNIPIIQTPQIFFRCRWKVWRCWWSRPDKSGDLSISHHANTSLLPVIKTPAP